MSLISEIALMTLRDGDFDIILCMKDLCTCLYAMTWFGSLGCCVLTIISMVVCTRIDFG